MNTHVAKNYYQGKYDSKRRFISYWHQIHEVLLLKPENVLEVGIGNGFVSRYLREQDTTIVTCDIDAHLKPDHIASVTKLPFADKSFDVVMACEILEHMPYAETLQGLGEIFRVSSQSAIISLPDATRSIYIEFPIPKFGKVKKLMVIPELFPKKHILTKGGHHWEIGKKEYPLSRIIKDIKKTGFVMEKTYRVAENPYHRFFVLHKS